MPRFDYYAGSGSARYLLDVQSDHLWQLPTRVMVPLGPVPKSPPNIRDLTPRLVVQGEELMMLTPFLAAMQRNRLGKPLGSLLGQADEITHALDILLAGF
jgi:toxin CcdB